MHSAGIDGGRLAMLEGFLVHSGRDEDHLQHFLRDLRADEDRYDLVEGHGAHSCSTSVARKGYQCTGGRRCLHCSALRDFHEYLLVQLIAGLQLYVFEEVAT